MAVTWTVVIFYGLEQWKVTETAIQSSGPQPFWHRGWLCSKTWGGNYLLSAFGSYQSLSDFFFSQSFLPAAHFTVSREVFPDQPDQGFLSYITLLPFHILAVRCGYNFCLAVDLHGLTFTVLTFLPRTEPYKGNWDNLPEPVGGKRSDHGMGDSGSRSHLRVTARGSRKAAAAGKAGCADTDLFFLEKISLQVSVRRAKYRLLYVRRCSWLHVVWAAAMVNRIIE